MKALSWMYAPFVGGRGAVGLLILRIVAGSALMLHGWQKISSPGGMFGWMPGGKVPAIFQGAAAFAEFGGGLALVLGLLTPVAALGIAITMLVAIGMVHLNDPFVGTPGKPSKESAAGYLAVALTLMLVGPGAFSLDALLFGKREETAAETVRERAPVS